MVIARPAPPGPERGPGDAGAGKARTLHQGPAPARPPGGRAPRRQLTLEAWAASSCRSGSPPWLRTAGEHTRPWGHVSPWPGPLRRPPPAAPPEGTERLYPARPGRRRRSSRRRDRLPSRIFISGYGFCSLSSFPAK